MNYCSKESSCRSLYEVRDVVVVVQRFQKTYESLEAESVQEKKQLSDLHQQRVQSELNEKTRVALDNYMQAIDDNDDVSAD